MTTDVNDPSLPRLGLRGCIICNGCISKESDSHCLYCGDYLAFQKNLKIWILSEAMAISASSSEDSYQNTKQYIKEMKEFWSKLIEVQTTLSGPSPSTSKNPPKCMTPNKKGQNKTLSNTPAPL
jgi:hypothetical protein